MTQPGDKNSETPERDTGQSWRWWLLLVIMAAVLPYLPSLGGGFCLDDWHLIVKSPLVHTLDNAARAFSEGFLPEVFGKDLVYYRPLVTVSYQANYALSGPDPLAFRLTNILLNLITAIFVFAIARKLTASDFAAGIAGTAFGVLPSHAQSVAWISGRTDVLSVALMLAAFTVFYRNCGRHEGFRWMPAVVCSVLFFCALLSKESALVLPVLLAIYAWVFGIRVRTGEVVRWAAVLVIPLVVYLALRGHVVGAAIDTHMGLLLKERLMGVGIAYATYLRMMFIPREMQVVYDVFPIGMRYPALAYAAWLIPAGLVGIGIWLRKRLPVVSFASLWIFITLLPVSNILPTSGPLPAERFVYLSSVGSSFLLGLAALGLYSYRPRGVRVWPIAAGAIICAYMLNAAALAVQGSGYYVSDVAWARAVARTQTRFPIFRALAGEALAQSGEFDEAESEYAAAISLDPTMISAYVGLARVKRWSGQPAEAVGLLEEASSGASEEERRIENLDFELGLALAEADETKAAAEAFENSVEHNPRHPAAWRNLGKARLQLEDYAGAAEAYERAFELADPRPTDRYELGMAYRQSGQPEKAAEQFKIVIETAPESEAAARARFEMESLKPD